MLSSFREPKSANNCGITKMTSFILAASRTWSRCSVAVLRDCHVSQHFIPWFTLMKNQKNGQLTKFKTLSFYRHQVKVDFKHISAGLSSARLAWVPGEGCAARFPNPLPYLWRKSAIFPTPFMTWPWQIFETLFMAWLLNQNPVSDQRYNRFPSSDQC